jgi:hypothetical protein
MRPAILAVFLSFVSISTLSFAGLGDTPSGVRKMGDGGSSFGGTDPFGKSTIQPTNADPNAPVKGTWPASVYSIGRLKEAQEEAYNTGKAVALIHTRIEETAVCVEASLDVEQRLRDTCVVVYAHSGNDNSKLPRAANEALHLKQFGSYIPKTVVLSPDLQAIIACIPYIRSKEDRLAAFNAFNGTIKNYLDTKLPSVRPGPQTNSVICVRAIDAFNPANPTQILGKFQPGSLLIIESTNLVQGLMPVKFTPPQGPAVPALCQPAALVVGN